MTTQAPLPGDIHADGQADPVKLSRVTVHITGLGYYEAPPALLDRAIAEYLPASAADLQKIVEERTADQFASLTVSESLIMLASFYADNPF